MSRISCVYIIISVLMAASVSAADKPAVDKRLDQPVTIQHTSGRLHSAIEKLSKLTGVRLTCGRDKDDWQIRDIPVIVCAKDVPLGKLLRAIADTTHLVLTSHKIENGISYRIWQTPVIAREIVEYERKRSEWEVATTAWEWDVCSKLKDVPELASAQGDYQRWLNGTHVMEVSPILAALGTEARDNIISGEPLRLSAQDAPENLKPLIERYLQHMDSSERQKESKFHEGRPVATDEDFQKSAIVFRYSKYAFEETPSLKITVEGPILSEPTGTKKAHLFTGSAKYNLPKQPEEPKIPRVPDQNSTSPIWETKVTLKMPKDKDPVTFGDVCAALAEASGCAVVAEDYHSHQPSFAAKLWFDRFQAGAPLRTVSDQNSTYQWWALDDKNKILMCTEKLWITSNKALAPEWLIEGLRQKLDTDGVMFDDVTPLANLTEMQLREWVIFFADLAQLRDPFMGPDKGLWAFYNNLSTHEKELAMSEDGLRLNQSAVVKLASIFREREESTKGIGGAFQTKENWWEKTQAPEQTADPILRLKSYEPKSLDNKTFRRYFLEFSGRLASETFTVNVPFCHIYRGFPVFSDKREAELAKAK